MAEPILEPDQRAALRAVGQPRRWRRGVALCHEGDHSDWVVLLERGQVKVFTTSPDGYETILALRGPGDVLGELSAIDGAPRSATVLALEPVEATVITADAFRGFLHDHPTAGFQLLRLVVGRLRDADRKRAEFGAQDTVTRVARRLLELTERFGAPAEDGMLIQAPLTQEDLAGWIGVSRESVSRALRSLRARQVISTDRRGIVIRDLDRLRDRAS